MAETSPSGRRARPRFSLHTLQAKVVALVAAAFLVTLGAATAYTVRSQRAAILATATEQAQALAKMCFDSLNVMMLTDNMESREIVTRRLAQDPKVVEARVIRGEPVTAEYDEGLDGERPVDDLDHRALAGEGVARVETVDGRRVFTFIRPLAASESRYDVNCLMCHHVEEGTVLGAIRIRYSLAEADAAFAAFLRRTLAINLGLFGLGLAAVAWWVRRGAVLPLRRMAATAREIAAGRVDGVVAHRSRDEIGALAEAFRAMVAYLRAMAEGAERLARGDAEAEVACQGDHDRLGCAFGQLREAFRDLLAEGDRLLAAARSGDLHRRAEAGRFPGAFGELLEGINRAMDAMAAPVDETLPALERLAAGDLSARVTGDYAGEYGQLKEAFNGAAEGLARVVRQVNERSEAVARAAAEIAEENRDLAGRLEQEAASLEETA
ncbi:MAG: methyl-accepting chemotaxis protein, partial [Nitrospirae bacterium]